ncbi:MAG: tRNA (adenosine(37)-N6)-threonylcarbamoyltransferase complex dimerization subunit type 1 TsaB [Sedimentisphaerales bacterium]|nr:tRNA (adenosine(37)-N6)-threonylcarbamoyltransferase complex dimerization subunit type 1 TsaB [Sedimentisphaerales bacterium]
MKKTPLNPVSLAIETSGRTGSVALGTESKSIEQSSFSGLMRHSIELFPTIEQLLKKHNCGISDLKQIFITIGPGSFTGLRIAVSTAKMFALATNVKIVAVNTMDVIAQNANDIMRDSKNKINRIVTILDAKRKQFYVASYKNIDDGWIKTTTDCLMTADDIIKEFADMNDPVYLLGEGLHYYKDMFDVDGMEVVDDQYWTATAEKTYTVGYKMAQEKLFTDPGQLVPFYLRRPEAEVNWEKRQKSL